MQVYIHALVQNPNNLDAAIRSAKIHVMLPDRVFQIALAYIDHAALPLSCRQQINHIHDFGTVTTARPPDQVSAV